MDFQNTVNYILYDCVALQYFSHYQIPEYSSKLRYHGFDGGTE